MLKITGRQIATYRRLLRTSDVSPSFRYLPASLVILGIVNGYDLLQIIPVLFCSFFFFCFLFTRNCVALSSLLVATDANIDFPFSSTTNRFKLSSSSNVLEAATR